MTGPVQRPDGKPPEITWEKPSPLSGAGVAGLGLVGMAFVLMATLTWRKWPDAIIDFGCQLYIPWRLSEGAVLYRDLYYFAGGPLSQYFNALLFKIFGVSYSVLIAANLAFSAVVVGFIYRRFFAITDALTATTISLGVVMVFTFSKLVSNGNYNFIAPYSHEVLHGILLSFFTLLLLTDWLARVRAMPALLAGFCTGLVFLTKPDIFLALIACCSMAFILCWVIRGLSREVLKSIGLFIVAAMLPSLFFFLLFLRMESWHDSLRSVVFGWLPAFEPAIRNNIFYVTFRGMERPLAHLREMTVAFSCAATVVAFYAIVFRWLTRGNTSRKAAHWVVWFVLLLPLLYWSARFGWLNCGSSLPLWGLTALVVLRLQIRERADAVNVAFPLLWSVFSLCLMSKLGVFARIYHCGFALTMPAFVTAVYFLMWLLPQWLETHWQVPSRFLRATFLPVLLVGYVVLLQNSQRWYDSKSEVIGHGGDKMFSYGSWIDGRDGIKTALDWVDTNVPTNATLAVLPSGVNLNYLSRRVNPTPCLFWDPNSMALWGQATMTARFESTPPDYIVIVDQSQAEFGVGNFGSFPNYGVELMAWIKANYKVAALIGQEPLKNRGFGVEILQRVPPASTAGIHSS